MAGATYPFTLTLVSNNAVSHHLNVLAGREGELLHELGSAENEAISRGHRSTIVIPNFQGGAGQEVAVDPSRYLTNEGWETHYRDALLPGLAITTSEISNNANYADTTFAVYNGGIAADANEANIYVAPKQLFEETTAVGDPPATSHFTGSWARFGDRLFFGAEHDSTRESQASTVKDVVGDSYNAAGGPTASHFVRVGNKLFRARYDATNRIIYGSWTDETGADSPTFSTEYPLPAGDLELRGVAAIGPHMVVYTSGSLLEGQIWTMDTEGQWTGVVPEGIGTAQILTHLPYLDGLLFILGGQPAALWMRSVTDIVTIDFSDIIAPEFAAINLLLLSPLAGDSNGRTFYIYDARIGLIQGELTPAGWRFHRRGTLGLQSGEVCQGLRFEYIGGLFAQLRLLTQEIVADNLNSTTIRLWTGQGNKATTLGDGGGDLTTAKYQGETFISKKFLNVRGYYKHQGGSTDITATVDGVAAGSGTLSATGPFSIQLNAAAFGRQIQLTIGRDASTDLGALLYPIEVDYFYVPDEKDVIRIPIVAGSQSLRRDGALEYVSEKDLHVILSDLCNDPEPWTLEWGDGRDDWTVLPLKVEGRQVEPELRPSEGTSVYWLTVQRL